MDSTLKDRIEAERTRLQYVMGILSVSADALDSIAENADDAVLALHGAREVLADINKALEEVWQLMPTAEVSHG